MRNAAIAIAALLAVCPLLRAAETPREDSVQFAEPFNSAYAGDDAAGKHVIAVWPFDGAEKLNDLSGNGTTDIAADFGPCDGKLYMIAEQAVAGVHIEAPKAVRPGEAAAIQVTVLGADGRPLDAVVPVRLDLLDPSGKAAEFSGYYGAKDGRLEIAAQIATNDTPGLWRIRAEELASGKTADVYMRVVAQAVSL